MSARIVLLLKQETISYGVEFDLIETSVGTVPCVTKVLDKSPARLAGVYVNDVFIRINGVNTRQLSRESISRLGKRYARHACVECVNKLDINQFDFSLGVGQMVHLSHHNFDLTNPIKSNYQMEYQFTIPRVIRVERDQLELEQFVYTLTEYNNFREGEFIRNTSFI